MKNTFKGLYCFLQEQDDDLDIAKWCETYKQGKFNGLESLLRLFASLRLIMKISHMTVCHGNIANDTLYPITSKRQIFYDENGKEICLKDSNNKIDCALKKDNTYLFISSKDKNKFKEGEDATGLLEIISVIRKKNYLKDKTVRYGLSVPSKDMFMAIIDNKHKTTLEAEHYDILKDENTIYIDYDDIIKAYKEFKKVYGNKSFEMVVQENQKGTIMLSFHQAITLIKTLEILTNYLNPRILFSHLPRLGKSMMMCSVIAKRFKDSKKCNILIMTTKKQETQEQFQRQFSEYAEFNDYNVQVIMSSKFVPNSKDKNIYFVSTQLLNLKDNSKTKLKWVIDTKWDMCFMDEFHDGGCTDKMASIVNNIHCPLVFMDGTPDKIINKYSIPDDNNIKWDLHDIATCQRIEVTRDILREKYGSIVDEYTDKEIKDEYSAYPQFQFMTQKITEKSLKEIEEELNGADGNYGYSENAIFAPKYVNGKPVAEIQDEKAFLNRMYTVFPKRTPRGAYCKDAPVKENDVILTNINNICKNNNSRYVDKMPDDKIMVIMMFIPPEHIKLTSSASKNLIEREKVCPDFDICCLCSANNTNPKTVINKAIIRAKTNGKKGLLVITALQARMAITVEECDIILLFNNSNIYDNLFQIWYRCMTPDKNKKYGFVVDLNIHRAIVSTVNTFSKRICPDKQAIKDKISHILNSKIIHFNQHDLEFSSKSIDVQTDMLYSTYYNAITNTMDGFINHFNIKLDMLSKNDYIFLKNLFKKNNSAKSTILDNVPQEYHAGIPNGVERETVQNTNENTSDTDDSDEDVVDDDTDDSDEDVVDDDTSDTHEVCMDALKIVVPTLVILTLYSETYELIDMFNLVMLCKDTKKTFESRIKNSTYSNSIDLLKLITILNKYINDKEAIIRFKEKYKHNLKSPRDIRILIDKFMVPSQKEKKLHAEVSTPIYLADDMINLVPEEFWKKPKKVFDPCCGKGSLLIVVIEKFMEGLKNLYPNEDERYKVIVEQCIYFADINDFNIIVCKQAIDPENKYKLTYFTGNSLTLNMRCEFNHSDLCIANPPFNGTNGNTGSNNSLWDKFAEKAITQWVKPDGYMLFVHPCGWRQYNHPVGKLMMSKQIVSLNMNNTAMGSKVFKCSTTFDYYLLKNCSPTKNTLVIDYKNEKYEIKIDSSVKFIPNHSINEVYSLVNVVDDNGFMNDQSSYEPRKAWMNDKRTDEYKYPCVYSGSNGKIEYKWSKMNTKGHFNISKFIFSNGVGTIKDVNGEYGLTQWAYAIKCSPDDMDRVEVAFKSDKFKNIVNAIKLTKNSYNYVIMKLFKKDFWKDFI